MASCSCTAVLIVRNEEAVLEACLRSVRDLVDEIVVLDTGSHDRTREVAMRAGARVFESRWHDDFSAARNEALALAHGTWILSIDADERLVRGSRDDLARLLAAEGPVAYRVWLRPGRLFTPFRHCRVFRNDPRIRFDGRIRESVLPSIRRMTGDRGSTDACEEPLIADCEIALDHLDHPAVRSGKDARDLRLLERAIESDGDSVLYWTDLGRALAGVGQSDRATHAWERAIELVRRLGARTATDSLPYTDLAQQTEPGDRRRKDLIDEAVARFPGNQLIVWLRAETLMVEGRFQEAERLLEPLAAIDGDRGACARLAYDRRIFGEFAYGALATCCFELGRWSDAAEWYGRAAAERPDSIEYRVKRELAASFSLKPAGSRLPKACRAR